MTINHGSYIVVWNHISGAEGWSSHDTRKDAEKEYQRHIRNPATYSASLTKVVDSTNWLVKE